MSANSDNFVPYVQNLNGPKLCTYGETMLPTPFAHSVDTRVNSTRVLLKLRHGSKVKNDVCTFGDKVLLILFVS